MKLELRVPPPLVGLITAGSMWLAATVFSGLSLSIPGAPVWAVMLVLLGIGCDLSALFSFYRNRTSASPFNPDGTRMIVTSGIYRFSRNPMYLGMLLMLAGWAVFLGNPIALLGLPLFILYMNRFQIGPEERILQEKFGAPYRQYLQQVRRWF